VSSNWVVNASPLIVLGKVGLLTLLPRLAAALIIPASVAQEIEAGPSHDPARNWLAQEGKETIRADGTIDQKIVAWDLGSGESAVLTWALQHSDCEAILDDRAARKCALVNGIPVRGSIGVILAARKRRLIPAAKPVLDDLVRAGLFIEDSLLREALRLVGE
jgi:predicted nucleic acid-binding protein